MENNKNYQRILEKQLQNIEISGKKPKLLIHACCGPCFTIPHEILKNYFDITILYNNSNIYPKEEHDAKIESAKITHPLTSANIWVILRMFMSLTPFAVLFDRPETKCLNTWFDILP